MGRKAKKNEDVKTYRHEKETRKNAVPVGLASYDISKPKKYEYDLHLDPQLIHNRTCNLIGKFDPLTSIRSIPFKISKENRIAVKVIAYRVNEVMVVREVE